MNRNYLDGFIGGAGGAAIVHGLITGNLNEATFAGISVMLYEAGQLGLEFYRGRQERRFVSRMIREGCDSFELARKLGRLP